MVSHCKILFFELVIPFLLQSGIVIIESNVTDILIKKLNL